MARSASGSLRRATAGSTAVEFALILPIFLSMLLGIIEFGRVMWIQNTLQFAAEEATRYAVVRSSATTAEITAYAKAKVTGINPESVTWTAVSDISEVRMNANYEFDFLVPELLPFGPIPLTASSRFPRG